jgi:hypothetical protein
MVIVRGRINATEDIVLATIRLALCAFLWLAGGDRVHDTFLLWLKIEEFI